MTGSPAPSHPHADRLVGVVVPYDMALDRELWRWAPPGVSLLFNRTPYNDLPVTVEMAETVGDVQTVVRSTQELRAVGPVAYAYGCTSGSFVNGVTGERRLAAAMQDAGGAPAVTTSGALLAALDALGVSRVATATPYDSAVTAKLTTFLEEAGLAVVSSAHLGLSGGIWTVDYETTRRLVRKADSDAAEAIVVSCTNLATYDVIAPLEAELGKPVVTANQVTMWAALRAIGVACVGPGQRVASL